MKKSIGLALCGLMLGAGANAATMKVDKGRSRIQVDAKATGHSFTGTLKDYTANVQGDASSLKPQAFELKWTFDNLKTGEKDRDEKMLEWLGGAKPAGSFTFTKTWDKGGQHYAMGNLTIHGVSKAISFPYTVQKDGDWVTIDGTATMDYTNFGLPIIRSMALMTVKPGLSIRFHLVGKI
ncbi:protein YceI [Haloferula sargassicola]|uniref:Protein YceI n=2 Tax=Haloferula sargassicola TaxID=490096 RepID=A0ABP9URT7_9BACT